MLRPGAALATIAIASCSGARTVAAPALASLALARAPRGQGGAARLLGRRSIRFALALLAATEAIIDKLPFAGDRTSATGLVPRALAGALAGAALAPGHRRDDRRWSTTAIGAVLGGVAATAATFATFRLRRALRTHVTSSNVGAGLLEDALVYGVGAWLVLETSTA